MKNTQQLAFTPDDPSVPPNRWIAYLRNGMIIYENVIPHQKSAWKRLYLFLKEYGLYINGLSLEAFGQKAELDVYIGGRRTWDGFWQSKGIEAPLSLDAPQIMRHGIGYIMNNKVYITWIREDGVVYKEERKYCPESDLAGILTLDCINPNEGIGKSC